MNGKSRFVKIIKRNGDVVDFNHEKIEHAIFKAIHAMALFGAAYFSQRYLAFLIPIISMWLSALVLNNVMYGQYFDHFVWFYQGFYWTYGAFVLIGLVYTGVLFGAFEFAQSRIPILRLQTINN